MKAGKRIFVTGATGMVGSYLLRYLVASGEHEIIALRRPDSPMDLVEDVAGKVEWVEGDLLDLPLLEGIVRRVDRIFHCAAMLSFDPREFEEMKKVNVEGTACLVDLALAAGIEKFLFVSSVETLGRTHSGETLDESKVWQRGRFNTYYAVSKFLAEQEVWRGQVEGLSTAIVNPAVVLGGGRWQDGPLKLFSLVWKKFPFYTAGISGFVDVRDVARFMIRLMDSPIQGERYLLSSENLSYREVMNQIADNLKRPRPRFLFSRVLRGLSWRLLLPFQRLGMPRTITKETVRLASYRFFLDNAKSLEAFPSFSYTPIRETIAETSGLFTQAAQTGFKPDALPLIPF